MKQFLFFAIRLSMGFFFVVDSRLYYIRLYPEMQAGVCTEVIYSVLFLFQKLIWNVAARLHNNFCGGVICTYLHHFCLSSKGSSLSMLYMLSQVWLNLDYNVQSCCTMLAFAWFFYVWNCFLVSIVVSRLNSFFRLQTSQWGLRVKVALQTMARYFFDKQLLGRGFRFSVYWICFIVSFHFIYNILFVLPRYFCGS